MGNEAGVEGRRNQVESNRVESSRVESSHESRLSAGVSRQEESSLRLRFGSVSLHQDLSKMMPLWPGPQVPFNAYRFALYRPALLSMHAWRYFQCLVPAIFFRRCKFRSVGWSVSSGGLRAFRSSKECRRK